MTVRRESNTNDNLRIENTGIKLLYEKTTESQVMILFCSIRILWSEIAENEPSWLKTCNEHIRF